jgi:2'-5' RNA ligase
MTRYALALILPREVENLLDQLRGNHGSQMAYIKLPHVTLGYFETGVDLSTVQRTIQETTDKIESFRITLGGIEYFHSDFYTAFVSIENQEPILNLRQKISKHLQEKVNVIIGGYDALGAYRPHITVGTNISDESFPAIKEMLSQQNVQLETTVETLVLGSVGEDGKMGISAAFQLSG